jgi:hypothetical protein
LLEQHSEVFRVMLKSHWKERQEGCVDLSLWSSEVVRVVLQFLKNLPWQRGVLAQKRHLLCELKRFAHMYLMTQLWHALNCLE